jgi:nucleoside recognition membrane protein YjiH
MEVFIMRALLAVGLVILVLGILSFFVPVPHSERHGIDAGDVHLGVKTHHDDLLPPAVCVTLLVVGAGLMIAGRKSGS